MSHPEAGSSPSGEVTVVIGWMARAHGVRGAVRARASGPTLPSLDPGEAVLLRGADGTERVVRVKSIEGEPERLILNLDGVHDRDGAAALSGCEIRVVPERVPFLADPDTFYVQDLLGCRVVAGERELGVVAEVHAGRSNDAFEVEGEEGRVLIPFTADAVVSLDADERTIVVREDLLA